ncbi:hypothetical protein PPERSA_01095 [Pseudocohnilembus persalinus]|uniref:F-BAR domain-containing protein n=1 Tax=Pseudocohnilembus persalinus TaxID=266149 RepID=A0A0V0QUY9_PSEPJ|nr:hypothetical protein PPERSA_01095 [Pseudocohnilembus persalinus]|eukprot:KRX06017.1 hypothetical protein PPERSA_01095 [Pseudocohnilembus persalinus]
MVSYIKKNFQNRFDLLKVHSTERRKLVEDFSKIIDEISNTEEQYARRLSYISIQIEKITQVRGNHLCANLFSQLLQTYKKQATEANITALRLKKEISLEIKSAIQNQNQVSTSLIQQGKNLQDGLQQRTQEIEKDIIMDKFQQQEDKRCELVHKSIFDLVNTTQSYKKESWQQMEKLQKNIAQVDLFGGTQEFIKQNKYPMPLFQKLTFYPLQTFNQQALTKYKQKQGYLQGQEIKKQEPLQNKQITENIDEEPQMKNNLLEQKEEIVQIENQKTSLQKIEKKLDDENISYEQNAYLYEKLLEKKNQKYSQIFYDIISNEQLPKSLPQELNGFLFENENIQFYTQNNQQDENEHNQNGNNDDQLIKQDIQNQFIHHPSQKLISKKLSEESKCIQIAQIILKAYKGKQIDDQQLLSSLKNFDSKILNKIMVLSLSYHKEVFKEQEQFTQQENTSQVKQISQTDEQKEQNQDKIENQEKNQNQEQKKKLVKIKQFLQEGLLYHQLWQQKDYWQTSIFESIMDQIDQQQVYLSQTTESTQQTAQRERSILFAQISFQIENMLLFHHPLNQTKDIIEFNLKHFDLGKEQINIIYERIKEYEQKNKLETTAFDSLKQSAKSLFGI